MSYRFYRALLALCLRIFYRRIEAPGLHSVPREGPLLLVANHGSALMDPLLLMTLLPRPISFLAKHTLFSMPVVGFVLRRIGGIPVHRKEDWPGDASHNEAMFEACAAVLESGGAVCLFPEGVSHDRPRLQPLKTGAARIYLRSAGRSAMPVGIIPVGINFEAKRTFRSRVLILFGSPVDTAGLASRVASANAREVKELTSRIEKALGLLVPGLDSWDELEFIRGIERLVLGTRSSSLAKEARALRQFIDAYQTYRRSQPETVREVRLLWEAYRRQLARFSMTDAQIDLARAPVRAARTFFSSAAVILLVLPLAALGVVVHFVPYRLVGVIERRVNRDADQAATVKLMAGLALFPATYLVLLAYPLERWGFEVAGVLLALLPIAGWAALLAGENQRRLIESAGALFLAVSPGRALGALRQKRRQILDRVEELMRARSQQEGERTDIGHSGLGR